MSGCFLHLLLTFICLPRVPNVYHLDANVHLFNVNETAEDKNNCAWRAENKICRRTTNMARGRWNVTLHHICDDLEHQYWTPCRLNKHLPSTSSTRAVKFSCCQWMVFNTEPLKDKNCCCCTAAAAAASAIFNIVRDLSEAMHTRAHSVRNSWIW